MCIKWPLLFTDSDPGPGPLQITRAVTGEILLWTKGRIWRIEQV